MSSLHVVQHPGEVDVCHADGGKVHAEGLVELDGQTLGVEVLEEKVIHLDDVLQGVVRRHGEALVHRGRLRLMLKEVDGHEGGGVILTNHPAVDVHAEQAKFEDVLPCPEVGEIVLHLLGG